MSYVTHADLGGQSGFGVVTPEPDGELFHAAWEPRALALALAMGATGSWNIDMSRAARETLPNYAALSYYEIWFAGLLRLLEERGLVRADELAAGRSMLPAKALQRVLSASAVAAALAEGSPTERPALTEARFAVGASVRTRADKPPHHTRLPGYVRGKRGVIERVHGAPRLCRRACARPGRTAAVALQRGLRRGRVVGRCGGLGAPGGRRRVGKLPGGGMSDDVAPPFDAPWQAQAFALALTLHERGVFTWVEWAEALSQQIAAAQAGGDADLGDTYYRHWLAALESLVATKGLSSRTELARYQQAWDHAADRTPHGQPIELRSADFGARVAAGATGLEPGERA